MKMDGFFEEADLHSSSIAMCLAKGTFCFILYTHYITITSVWPNIQ